MPTVHCRIKYWTIFSHMVANRSPQKSLTFWHHRKLLTPPIIVPLSAFSSYKLLMEAVLAVVPSCQTTPNILGQHNALTKYIGCCLSFPKHNYISCFLLSIIVSKRLHIKLSSLHFPHRIPQCKYPSLPSHLGICIGSTKAPWIRHNMDSTVLCY